MLFFLTISLTYLSLIRIIIHAEETFDCTGYEDDSYHSIYDADDCRHYWHCIYVDTVYMHAVRRVCPSGTEFDATLRQCETSELVNCVPSKSPHGPRTTTTTRAWKWRYSRLFSRKRWKPTMPNLFTTRKHSVFDLEEPPQIDTTTFTISEEELTTEKSRVLPMTRSSTTTPLSLEQFSKNLHALALQHRPNRNKPVMNFFQPGDPYNEGSLYVTTSRPTRRTRRTTTRLTSTEMTTAMPLATGPVTTEDIVTNSTPTFTSITTVAETTPIPTTTPMFTSMPSLMPEYETSMNPLIKGRASNGQRRRKNMTLYILSSDDHKIRQFSLNHTRGILINCDQLRRRLLGRRLRDIFITTTEQSIFAKQTSHSMIQGYSSSLLLCTLVSWFVFTKMS